MEPQIIESNLNNESLSEIESHFNELISIKNRSEIESHIRRNRIVSNRIVPRIALEGIENQFLRNQFLL